MFAHVFDERVRIRVGPAAAVRGRRPARCIWPRPGGRSSWRFRRWFAGQRRAWRPCRNFVCARHRTRRAARRPVPPNQLESAPPAGWLRLRRIGAGCVERHQRPVGLVTNGRRAPSMLPTHSGCWPRTCCCCTEVSDATVSGVVPNCTALGRFQHASTSQGVPRALSLWTNQRAQAVKALITSR